MTRPTPLLLQIQPGDARPLMRQIVDGVRRQVAAGELPVGALLPSVRLLAQQLVINPNTVAKAYAELCAEGWLESRPGLGLFVAVARERLSQAEQQRRLNAACSRFVDDVIGLDFSPEQVCERMLDELRPFGARRAG
ncbi:MAG: GntR family transcriptional regulator [Inhella sp.]|jgi:GntR family transcriptional regulator|uniref:GntR family transcriptional regulator n=2 Tax=Inhella sp. TaxID=1921806 RepID=UPI0022C4334A|nr:GntR family transcriptional regulator [Inhella sp.]MCZ8234920.1 GntR family transcriptional regulator [Inhella sp.]